MYLTDQWVRDRNKEFEEMKFRQRGHKVEDPVDFFQRRTQYHSFIFSDADDEWNKEVNERMCPTIDLLMEVAQHSQASLMSTWVLTNKVDRLLASPSATPAAPRTRFRPRAHVADVEVEEETELEEKEEEKTVMAADQRQGPRTGGSQEAGPSCLDWPGGKTVNGYSFA
jgi:hypothetical protein